MQNPLYRAALHCKNLLTNQTTQLCHGMRVAVFTGPMLSPYPRRCAASNRGSNSPMMQRLPVEHAFQTVRCIKTLQELFDATKCSSNLFTKFRPNTASKCSRNLHHTAQPSSPAQSLSIIVAGPLTVAGPIIVAGPNIAAAPNHRRRRSHHRRLTGVFIRQACRASGQAHDRHGPGGGGLVVSAAGSGSMI